MRSFIRKHAVVLIVFSLVPLAGCEAPTSGLARTDLGHAPSTTESWAIEDFSSVLTRELDLSDSQQADLRQEFEHRGHPDRAPGNLWFVSVRLLEILNERQKAALFDASDRLRDEHLRQLVGVYGPCSYSRPVDFERPEQLPVSFLLSVMTEEQLRVVATLREQFAKQMIDVRHRLRSGAVSQDEAARLMEQLHSELTEEIQALLTEEQIAQIEERFGASSGGENTGNSIFAHNRRAMVAALGLDESQSEALDQLHREQCSALEEVVASGQAGELSREEMQTALARLVAARHEAYDRILDDRQFEAAMIHDALLVVNARRYVHHVIDGQPGISTYERHWQWRPRTTG